MNRLFFIGDVHGSLELKKLSNKRWPLARELDRSDIVCILGDAGFMWDDTPETRYWDDWTEERNFTTIAVMGNHECYPKIRTLPAELWNGGIVRKVRPHVMYMETGEIFNINGFSFFVMNGAASTDKHLRTEGKNWYSDEIPSYEMFEHAANNLRAHGMKVDYILSHTTSNRTIQKFDKWCPRFDPVTNFLDKFVEEEVDFRANLFGHYHIDRTIDDKHLVLYNDILELLPNGKFKVVN